MSKRKRLSDEDIELFRREIGEVNRLNHDKVPPAKTPPRALPKQTLADQRQVLDELLSDSYDPYDLETGEELIYIRPGLQHRLLHRLRRGQFSIGAELDLHGLNVSEANARLAAFLRDCAERNVRCIRVIHGKGLRSPNGRPVLKGKLDNWLRRRDDVAAFCSARAVDGGTGAIYVLLRRG